MYSTKCSAICDIKVFKCSSPFLEMVILPHTQNRHAVSDTLYKSINKMVERKTKPCKNTLVQKPHVISIKHNPFWISNHIIGKKKKKI